MTGGPHTRALLKLVFAAAIGTGTTAAGQVFTIGEATATADIDTRFSATNVELPTTPMSERGRRELLRDLESEQGFAHRALPLSVVVLQANGNLTPGPVAYKKLIYDKGQAATVGDRVAVTALEFKKDRLIVDLNGGPYPPHRFLSHIQIGVGGAVSPDPLANAKPVTGCRITLVFEGGLPEVSAADVKALLYPLVDFGAKSSTQAYAETLPSPIRSAIASHELLVGMTRRMVLAAMGAPESKVRETDPGGERYEDWIYGHQPQTIRFVRFVGDRVSQIKVAELGKPMQVRNEDEMAGYRQPRPTSIVTVGDREDAGSGAKTGDRTSAPSLKKPGEVLTSVTDPNTDNGKVQYPVEKKPAAGGPITPPAAPGTASTGAPQ